MDENAVLACKEAPYPSQESLPVIYHSEKRVPSSVLEELIGGRGDND